MGPYIILFREAISNSVVNSIFQLGPNYLGAFLPEK